MQRSSTYTIGFAAAVCIVCSVFVSGSAVALKDRQVENRLLDRQKKVLLVSGLMQEGEKIERTEITSIFDERIVSEVIDMKTGRKADGVDPNKFDMRKASKDPALSAAVEDNKAKVKRMAHNALIYKVKNEAGKVTQTILPITGPGLWSTLYGYVALADDGNTIKGLIFYQHGETPGLGGEVDNPRWKAKWPGRKVFDKSGKVAIKVIKGAAGTPAEAPHAVDGLSGATITANGVTHGLHFWLGEQGFGPYLSGSGR